MGHFGSLAGALLLGWLVGYERYFRGRSSGSQVYCLVCTTSCAITTLTAGETTHVIGSILQGIGFLGAGIIVRTGLNVRGLTTAASIWAAAAIGILVGMGSYATAVGLTLLFMVTVALLPRIERALPAHAELSASVQFREGFTPNPEHVKRLLAERGLRAPHDSLSVTKNRHGRLELNCLLVTDKASLDDSLGRIVGDLTGMAEVESFTVTPSSRA